MTCLAIDHDFTSKILNLKLSIPESNGSTQTIENVIASAFFWYIKIHFCNMQQSIWMNNSWYKVRACFDMYSLTLVLINWNKSFRKIVKRQTQTGIVYKFIEIFNNAKFALNSSLRFLGQRDGVKYGSFQCYICCVLLFLCSSLECPIENKSCVLKFWLITF